MIQPVKTKTRETFKKKLKLKKKLKPQQSFISEEHNTSNIKVNKIALSSNNNNS